MTRKQRIENALVVVDAAMLALLMAIGWLAGVLVATMMGNGGTI